MRILNQTRNTVLADRTILARTSAERRRGLLKRSSLPKGEGIVLSPCEGVHSFFMKFPIDVIYINKRKQVVKIVPKWKPWRISFCWRAHAVVELPAGIAEETGTQVGDQLVFERSRAGAGE